ncbi:MFS transporter [Vibrio sp. 11986-1-5]|uniref:MFS transporter n=1 Tax=Vibrio sp. 11986-1-5 TaxID=2211215 RepID=UPI000D729CA1|nr:MFS transporter [Vibrio sp. 11986-1-5]PXA74947.1 MFS transporter [Vibrio sp. 11986-1-5]
MIKRPPVALLNDWQLLSPAGKVLVANSLSFNLGFYMLMPYLADHLQGLGLSSAYIGLVIGLRVLSQQGLFLVGGTLGDWFGYKPMILFGCMVRIVGFLMLALSVELPWIIVGAFATGFAGALFTPSSQAFLAAEYPENQQRNRVFALQNLASEAGMLLGPLLGLMLLSVSFTLVGVLSAGIFVLLLLLQWFFLPDQKHQINRSAQQPFWRDWLEMLHNKPFMAFVMAASIYQVLFHQLYMAIPYHARVETNDPSIITWVFMVSSLMGVTLQMIISRWIDRSLGTAKGMGWGMSLMGGAFLILTLSFPLWPALPFVLCAALLSFGSMMVFPLLSAYVPNFASSTKLASYYGLQACIGGIFAFIGNSLAGWLLGLNFSTNWIWITLALLGVFSGVWLHRQTSRAAF